MAGLALRANGPVLVGTGRSRSLPRAASRAQRPAVESCTSLQQHVGAFQASGANFRHVLQRTVTHRASERQRCASTSSSSSSPSPEPSRERGAPWNVLLPPREAGGLLRSCWQLLRACFWPVIIVYALKDTAAFMLHRFGHRFTNAVAEAALGVDMASVTNLWWLCLDSSFLEGNIGYQVIIAVVFLLCLPINIMLNSYALTAIMQIMQRLPVAGAEGSSAKGSMSLPMLDAGGKPLNGSSGSSSEIGGGSKSSSSSEILPSIIQDASSQHMHNKQGDDAAITITNCNGTVANGSMPTSKSGAKTGELHTSREGSSSGSEETSTSKSIAAGPQLSIFGQLKEALKAAVSVVPSVNAMLMRVWWTDLMFNLRALPLQAFSLLVVPLFWTLPRLLAIQLAVPIAISEGLNAKDALERSKEMMTGFRRGYAWPYLSLLVGIRLLDMVRTFLLAVMPARYWQELVELPIVLIIAFAFAKIVVIRLQDIMPAAAYISRKSPPAESEDSAVVEEQSVVPRILPSM